MAAGNHIVVLELNIFDFPRRTIILTSQILWLLVVIVQVSCNQTKWLLLHPEVMHGLLVFPVKQIKTSLFFWLIQSDTQHENVATAAGGGI